MKVTFDIARAVVVESKNGPDSIHLEVQDLESPFPAVGGNHPCFLVINAAAGYGANWCRHELNLNPEIVNKS